MLDIEEALAHLAARGARLIDEFPRKGGERCLIAFVHPSDLAGTLIELVEHPMAEFEIRGGAGPYEAAAIIAVFNRLLAEASAAAGRPTGFAAPSGLGAGLSRNRSRRSDAADLPD